MSERKVGNLTVWRNVFRHEDKNHPHYRGKCTIGNRELDIALWVNEEAGGVVLKMGGEFVLPEGDNGEPFDDDIPF